MKKLLLALVAMLVVSGAFAQDYKNSIGLRLGYGAEVQYERHFSSKNYLEANLGLYGFGNSFHANASYNWNCFEWNWTPNVGKWFLSAGVGGALGTWGYTNAEGANRLGFQVGVLGDVAFGIRFKKPVTLSLDYRPTIYFLHNAWGAGFYGVALTCTYNF
jgi:hypothetical protein